MSSQSSMNNEPQQPAANQMYSSNPYGSQNVQGSVSNPSPYSAAPSMPYASQQQQQQQLPQQPLAQHMQMQPMQQQQPQSQGYGQYGVNMGGTNPYMQSQPPQPYAQQPGNAIVGMKDQAKSLDRYERFMKVCISIASGAALLALIVLGWRGLYVSVTLCICVGSFMFSLYLVRWMLSKGRGATVEMHTVSDAIKEGAEGFLSVQYTAIAKIAVVVAVSLFFIYLFRQTPPEQKDISTAFIGLLTMSSFLLGAFCSALAGYMGVWVSVRVNIRVAAAATEHNYTDSLLLSFRGGAVSSILSASLCILGISLLYLFCHIVVVGIMGLSGSQVPMLLAGYGFGASFVALFMQLGGGIYTKAADVGADLVGKVERSIPEDDPRNPAVIADLVGDNVGDCAGSMADVFESIAGEIIGTMILGSTLAHDAKLADPEAFIFFPLIIHAFDLVVSSVGIYYTRVRSDNEDPLAAMKRGYAIAMVLAITGFFVTCRFLLYTDIAPDAWWHFALCGMVGIIVSYLLILITQYYTDYAYGPVRHIAQSSRTGHATNIIAGLSVGLESTGLPVVTIAAGLLITYSLGSTSGLPGNAAGVYGTAVATMGMLCTAVFVLSMNNFGPIADNAGGVVEMSGQAESVRVITDKLDAVGNVTKAAAKGYAVGGSALACFVLFQAFMDEITALTGEVFNVVNLARVEVVVGGLVGIMMVFLFTGWAIAAVGKTAQHVIWEVRRQLKSRPGIMDFTEKPDYHRCVSIVTQAALREMIKPAALALITPVFIGFLFRYIGAAQGNHMLGVEVVAAFLIFGTLTGLLMAILLDNAGGAWDNAKKYIEATGGKNSEEHKASVTGDTVGDPCKDTAGPALHVIITTMSTTVLVLGPMFVGYKTVM
jgi:H+-translocating diphosphatase